MYIRSIDHTCYLDHAAMTTSHESNAKNDNTASTISSNIRQRQTRKDHHEILIEPTSETGRHAVFSFRAMEFWTYTSPRLIARNLPFHQSRNEVSIQNKHGSQLRRPLWRLYQNDWFHVFLRWPTAASVTVLLSVWTAFLLFFAWIYVAVDGQDEKVDCGLGPTGDPLTYFAAFAFSLETSTTVGYTLPGALYPFTIIRWNVYSC